MTKLEFGNPEHIALAEKGMLCQCGHTKKEHDPSGIIGCTHVVTTEEAYCVCSCGDTHFTEVDIECDCVAFISAGI